MELINKMINFGNIFSMQYSYIYMNIYVYKIFRLKYRCDSELLKSVLDFISLSVKMMHL